MQEFGVQRGFERIFQQKTAKNLQKKKICPIFAPAI
jgi:hypothetical protein